MATERIQLLNAARLQPAEGPLPSSAVEWFRTYRPEDDWPWLTVSTASDDGVLAALIRLVSGVGVPARRVYASDLEEGLRSGPERLIACFELESLGSDLARVLIEGCRRAEKTLLATTRLPDGDQLTDLIGEDAYLSLWERGTIVGDADLT